MEVKGRQISNNFFIEKISKQLHDVTDFHIDYLTSLWGEAHPRIGEIVIDVIAKAVTEHLVCILIAMIDTLKLDENDTVESLLEYIRKNVSQHCKPEKSH